MLNTTIEVILVLVAFILGFYTKFFQEAWDTAREYKWSGVVAVKKALLSPRTFIPLIIMVLLIGVVVGLNYWQSQLDNLVQEKRDKDLIQAVNQHTDEKTQSLIERMDRLITILEAQNATGNTTTK
jgi:hypothetical protein